MTVIFGTNSKSALRYLGAANAEKSRSIERLATGLRINHASDDASGLAIAASLNTNVRVYSQGIANLNDGISILNIASDSLGLLSGALTRMRELAVQSASGTLNASQRSSLNSEAQQLRNEFNRIIESTSFNGLNVLYDFGQIRIEAGNPLGTAGIITNSSDIRTSKKGNGEFGTSSLNAPSGSGPAAQDLGDFNNDGIVDIVYTTTNGGGATYVQLGNGDGTFGSRTQIVAITSGTGVEVGDVNNDGKLDILATGNGGMRIMIGDGNGGFSLSQSITGAVQGAVLADLNGDSYLDIASVSNGSSINIRYGAGTGMFGAVQSYSGGASLAAIEAKDLNGDGKMEVIAASTSAVQIFNAQSDGTYASGSSYSGLTGISAVIAIGDINNDGKVDIVSNGSGLGYVGILIGNGNATFQARQDYSLGAVDLAQSLALGDIDNDGKQDLAIGGASNSYVMFNNGGVGFDRAKSLADGTSIYSIKFADLNGDGAQDIVGAANSSDRLNIHLATGVDTSRLAGFSISTIYDSMYAIKFLSNVQSNIEGAVGRIGADQSRLQSALSVLSSSRDNMAQAGSRITSADMAEESANLLRSKIKEESAAAIAAYVSVEPRLALSLLTAS